MQDMWPGQKAVHSEYLAEIPFKYPSEVNWVIIKYYSCTIWMREAETFFLQKKNLIKNPAAFVLKAEADHHTRQSIQDWTQKGKQEKEGKQQQWPPSYTLGNACLEELHENIQT